jgi:DNA polymerase V
MDGENDFFGAAYKGSRQFTQQQVKTANATGFGAAADDYAERGIDLNEQLIRNKPATFFFRMKGDAMIEAGIFDQDILIVDRSLKPMSGKIIVAILNGELLVRRFHKNFTSAFLVPENSRYKPINLSEFSDFAVWGVVTYAIHPFISQENSGKAWR